MIQAGEAQFTVVERPDLLPLCPHCGRELAEVYSRARGFPLMQGRTHVYFCPHCRKILGFARERVA